MESPALDSLLNVIGLLTRPELDDANVREAVGHKGVFLHDGFDRLAVLADRQDDATIARYLAAGDQKVAGRVVLLQEADVRCHLCIDRLERGCVDELDDEHATKRKGCRSPWPVA